MDIRAVTLVVATLFSSGALAQQGQATLDLFVNAYHDQQSFSQTIPGALLQKSLQAEDHTVSPPGSSSVYSSDHYATAFGSVAATQISVYSSARHAASINQGTYGVGGLASAYASVTVPFLIPPPNSSLIGTMGSMVVPLIVTGDVTLDTGFYNPVTFANTDGRAWVGFNATGLSTNPDCTVAQQCRDVSSNFQGTVVKGNGVAGTWIVSIPFQFGAWSSYSLSATTYAKVGGNAGWGQSVDHEGISDFSHTLRWGGISAVLDAQGNPVTGWTVQSLPGVDLTTPVPELGTWGLMLAGLTLFGWKLRRRIPAQGA